MFAAALQMDGENGPDLVLGSKRRGASIGWLRAPALVSELRNWRHESLRDAGWIMSIETADLDGDGDTDLLVSDREDRRSGVSWFENPGSLSTGAWREHALAAQGEEVLFVDAVDLDGDGRLEVVAVVKPMRVVIARREPEREPAAGRDSTDGPGWSTRTVDVDVPWVGTAKAVRGADLDLDGRVDLVLSCEDAEPPRSGVFWMRATGLAGEAAWEVRELGGPRGSKFDLLATVDVDGDGDLDVITCEEAEGLGVIWYENPVRGATR